MVKPVTSQSGLPIPSEGLEPSPTSSPIFLVGSLEGQVWSWGSDLHPSPGLSPNQGAVSTSAGRGAGPFQFCQCEFCQTLTLTASH